MLLQVNAVDQRMGRFRLLFGRFHGRTCGHHRKAGMLDILGRHHLIRCQRLTAFVIGFGTGKVAATLLDQFVVLAGTNILLAQLAHGFAQLCFSLTQRDLGIGGIQLDHFFARFDEAGFIGANIHHRTVDLRGQGDQIATNIGIVGFFALREHSGVVNAITDTDQQKGNGQCGQHRLAFSRIGIGLIRHYTSPQESCQRAVAGA